MIAGDSNTIYSDTSAPGERDIAAAESNIASVERDVASVERDVASDVAGEVAGAIYHHVLCVVVVSEAAERAMVINTPNTGRFVRCQASKVFGLNPGPVVRAHFEGRTTNQERRTRLNIELTGEIVIVVVGSVPYPVCFSGIHTAWQIDHEPVTVTGLICYSPEHQIEVSVVRDRVAG